MRAKFFTRLSASLLLLGSVTAARPAALGVPHQACTADIQSLCAGITGQAKIRECFLSHLNSLSAACSDSLSKKLSVVKECASDVTDYCSSVKSGHNAIAKCLRGHLRELSPSCRAQLALAAAPDNAP
jgi:Cysteine rich repeat